MDPFQLLPVEVHLNILDFIRDLCTLHCVIETSEALAKTFDTYGPRWLDHILEVDIETQHTTREVRWLMHIFASTLSPGELRCSFESLHSWDAGRRVGGFEDICPSSFGHGPHLRQLLAAVYDVQRLTFFSLHMLWDRITAAPKLHFDSKRASPYRDLNLTSLIPWFELEGQPYTPTDDGGPFHFMEVNRMQRALWRIYIFCNLTEAAAKNELPWSKVQLRKFRALGFHKVCSVIDDTKDQTATAYECLKDIVQGPLPHEIFRGHLIREACANLPVMPPSWTVHHPKYGACPTDTDRFPREDVVWHGTMTSSSCRVSFLKRNRYARAWLRDVDFSVFRRLGFSIWDLDRMSKLELWKTGDFWQPRLWDCNVAFTWRNLLPRDLLDMKSA